MTYTGRASLLWILSGLFFLRVLGQIYVGLYEPPWLPPWQEWYSGLLPYPILIPMQIMILMWMAVVCSDNSRGGGRFFIKSDRTRRLLRWVSYIYAGSMIVRYALVTALMPEMRWMHDIIPVIFHIVLAGYVYTLALKPKK